MNCKYLLSFCFVVIAGLFAKAQQPTNNYTSSWKKVDLLIQKSGLPQSALVEVNKIYALAKKENNDPQIIKSLIYKTSLQQTNSEDAEQKSIRELEKEITAAREPARSILNSIVAESYWQYFQQKRYRLYDRTQTVNFKKDDLETWGPEDFHQKISALYLASIKNETLLQQTKLEPFDAILVKGNSRYLRPSLFDLLTHRALDYFKNDEQDITKPAYAFEIDSDSAFAEVSQFISYRFRTRDTLSLHFKALQLYQRILKFHLNDKKPDALIDADIDRVAFVKSYGVMQNKDSLYRQSLGTITLKYSDHPVAAQAWFLIAASYADQARQYQPLKDETYRYSYIKAKEICSRVVAQKDSSEGKANCDRLLKEIESKEINLQTEKVNIPDQPFRSLVSFRNFTQLHFRIIPMDKATKESLTTGNTDDNQYWTKLLRIPAIKTSTQSLPDTKDHQKHHAEIKIDALPVGQYALVASVSNDFSIEKNWLAVQFIYVSNLAWIKKGDDYFVLNRESGQPVARASVQAWYRYYDNQANKYKDRKGENLFTDKNGQFTITPLKANRDNYLRIELSTNNDRLFMDDYDYTFSQPSENIGKKETKTTFLFTDRAIYRPGQLFYFKGIAVSTSNENRKSVVLANLKTKVILFDVNQQAVDSVSVTTNEFGSYSGKFTLPSNLVNGDFRIGDQITGGERSFSIEEYKRPKFSVEIRKPEGTYRLNDTITVTGNAKAFAGNNINDASVKYRIVRRTIYPLWYQVYSKMIWPPRRSEEIEIANGETKTGANGDFVIPFKAIPDLSIEKKGQPTFYYEVSANVTDINGETRAGNTSVAVAYQALKLSIDVPEKVHTDSVKNIRLTSLNLNDIYEKASVTLTIHQLKTPTRIFRTRYWNQPDQFVMTREEYYRLFPYDIYSDETDPSKWGKAEKVLEVTDTTSSNSKFKIQTSKFSPGWYVIEAVTKDKYGEEVKDIKYVQVFNETKVNPLAYGDIEAEKTVLEPGDKTSYQINTNLDSVFVIHGIERSENSLENKFVSLTRNNRKFEIAIAETDHGGLGLDIAFVKYNRLFTNSVEMLVPLTNKDLFVSYETFRDKTLPGSEETWKIKITGYKGDKVAAEILTTMYDASLDEFRSHQWYKPSLWNFVFNKREWKSGQNFINVSSMEKITYPVFLEFIKSYDFLITTGFAGRGGGILEREYGRAVPGTKLLSMAKVKEMPDWSKDPDGSRGIMLDAAENKAEDITLPMAIIPPSKEQVNDAIQIRKNFNETAFFFPDLKTDSAGNISFSFTMPEALTKWKWMSLAHTKELAFGYEEKTIITQKDLMVQPNAPRFLREGDRMDFSAKIVNMTDKELTGQVQLQFFDPSTNTPVDGWFQNVFPNQYFTVGANQSVPASFSIEIPFRYNKPVSYRIVARTADTSGNFSDGEEALLPVISNRLLVTESLQLPMRGEAEKNFKFNKLIQSSNSETLDQYAVTVEFTSNPAWYAVQSLPYLNDYPYECAEQTFNRYYANALASKIANASPRIKQIFERWKTQDTAALLSNLQKNPELKSVLLEETPWVLQAKSEAEQKRNIALLFDMVRMNRELQSSLDKLVDMQTGNGGFVWFKGGADDRYITQYILTGIGHLKKLGALPAGNPKLETIITKAIGYLDNKIKTDLDELEKRTKQSLPVAENIGYIQIQYLYMRSFFTEKTVPGNVFKAYNFYRKQSQQYWLKQTRYMQGMIALALNRTGDIQTAKGIMNSLKQNSINSEEMGMYWKEITGGYYWHQAPIESHSLLIEAFAEITKDPKLIMDLRIWLLKQKQTQNWRTTKATADACYALLLPGGQQNNITDLLANTPVVTIQLGDQIIRSDSSAEAGTGYFKETITSGKIKPAMGNIKVSLKSGATTTTQPSWGAVYWQYFENLENIRPAATPLKLKKKLFVEKNTDRGPVLQPVNDGDILKTGDKIKVRIEISSDRDMEYVHMKDMRAASMEPVNVISEYKWQGGLGYYESTKDASTNFFFSWLPKGTYVFEYPVFITHTGTFSNGVTSIQCMYAPEFASHSEGIKINVEQ